MSRIYNFFNLRWTDGYSHVSDAPTEVIVDLETIMAQQPAAISSASITTQRARVGEHRDASLGILKLDVDVGGRRCSYNHVLVLASGYAPLPGDRWLRIVRDRYGSDVESRIQLLYEQLAQLEKADGRHELEPLEVHPDDVASLVVADNGSAPAGTDRAGAAPPRPIAPVRSAPRARLPAWTLPAAIVIAAACTVAWIVQRGDSTRCDEVDDNPREACGDLRTKLDNAHTQIDELKDENTLCLERKTGNLSLDTCLTKQLECETRASVLRGKVTRLEALRNDADPVRKAEAPRREIQCKPDEQALTEKDKALREANNKYDMIRNQFREVCELCRAPCSTVCRKPGRQ